MNLKLSEILVDDFLSGINKIGKANLSMKTAFKLKDITTKVRAETEKYRELVKDLFEKYGKKDKNGNLKHSKSGDAITVELKDQEKFEKAHTELLSIEVEFEGVQVKFEELEDIKISPNEIYAVSKIIDFVE